MRKNSIRKGVLHSSLLGSRAAGGAKTRMAGVAVAAAIAAAGAWGLSAGYARLKALWLEQCVVTDVSRQVRVITGSNIKPDVILWQFGLKNGANLAKIDFESLRRRILETTPNIRSLSVVRKLPSRVEITVEERDPVARMNTEGGRSRNTGRVADAEGVVFMRQDRSTALLPVLFEPKNQSTPPGARLEGRARAALSLICACREPELAELGVQAVLTRHPDHLTAILKDYKKAYVSWEGIDSPSPESDAAMRKQLECLRDTRREPSSAAALVFNATEPMKVFADTKEPIP